MVIKIVYDQALIYFALIGDKSSKGDTNIITKSVKIGFKEINIRSKHTFCSHNIRIVIEFSNIFGANVYANALLHIRSYAPLIAHSI